MADNAKVLIRRAKMLGAVGFGSLAVSAALLSFGAGSASADELAPDPAAPTGGPIAEDGVRPSGWQEYDATQNIVVTTEDDELSISSGDGVVDSDVAVPVEHSPDIPVPDPGTSPNCIADFAGC